MSCIMNIDRTLDFQSPERIPWFDQCAQTALAHNDDYVRTHQTKDLWNEHRRIPD